MKHCVRSRKGNKAVLIFYHFFDLFQVFFSLRAIILFAHALSRYKKDI